MEHILEKTKSSPAEFVETLLTEGDKVSCDDVNEDFRNHNDLPPFYDEELFKRGQNFFYKHLFAFFVSKCLGLIAVLSVPSILKMLMFTKMSSSIMTAYRRYVATILHMMVWYDSDFRPGSKMWKSIAEVRHLHNSASTRSCSAGMARISQKDMVLTQFGFMGIALCRSKMLGIHKSTEEEWRSFIHIWRVIGYLMGIEDRFNLCNGTVQEARERCNILFQEVFRPRMEERDENFINMSRYMVEGLWSLNMLVTFESIMCYLYMLAKNENTIKEIKTTYFVLNPSQKSNLNFLINALHLLSWNWFRVFQNYTYVLALWFVRVFPFVAFFQYGFNKGRVRILVNK